MDAKETDPTHLIATKDIIKVEVWDVVDKGIQSGDLKASSNSALKIDNNARKNPFLSAVVLVLLLCTCFTQSFYNPARR